MINQSLGSSEEGGNINSETNERALQKKMEDPSRTSGRTRLMCEVMDEEKRYIGHGYKILTAGELSQSSTGFLENTQ